MRINTRIAQLLLAGVFSFALTGTAFSQNTITVKAPHGGQVKEAGGNYFIETLFTKDKSFVFLLDASVNPVGNTGISGNVVFQLPDSSFVVSDFIPYLSDGFQLKGMVPAYTFYTVNFDFGGRRISAGFAGNASGNALSDQQ